MTSFFNFCGLTGVMARLIKRSESYSVIMEMAKVINSGSRLIPDGFCFLEPLEKQSILTGFKNATPG